MSRVKAREDILKLVYEYIYLGIYNDITLETILNESDISEDEIDYVKNSYMSVIKNHDEIFSIIKKHIKYNINQLNKVDLSILMVAVNEICILNNQNIKVEINEAIELAKKYSTDNSYKFINGVLASIVNGDKKNDE